MASPEQTSTGPATVALAGDVHFEGELAERLDENPDTALGPIAETLRGADVAMVNLESAITTGGEPASKAYTFRAPPAAFRALDSAGVDVVTMANNHGLDFGQQGLDDSLDAAEAREFPVVGIGRNAKQAYAPYTVTVGKQRIGILGATQVLNSALVDAWTAGEETPGLASAKDVDRLVRAVRTTRSEVDALIVYLHWGRSGKACPLPRQRRLARTLAEAGADAVVGTHAHRLQAGGFLRGSYVHYGLGNFVWYTSSGASGRTGVLTLSLEGDEVRSADWTPATITSGVPHRRTGAGARRARQAWTDLRQCTDLSPTPQAG